jgi:hypothetical protein
VKTSRTASKPPTAGSNPIRGGQSRVMRDDPDTVLDWRLKDMLPR